MAFGRNLGNIMYIHILQGLGVNANYVANLIYVQYMQTASALRVSTDTYKEN